MLWRVLRHAGVAGLLVVAFSATPARSQADELEPLYRQYKAHLAERRYGEAETVARRMVAVTKRSAEEKPALLAESLYYLADACSALHRYAEAEAAYKRSAAIREEIYGPDYLLVALPLNNLEHLKASDEPASLTAAARGLAMLWGLLVPLPERTAILHNDFQRLIVVPDGALAQFPFETLVTDLGQQPRYLLDSDVPVEYAPSATILVNLAERAAQGSTVEKPVLTVGDPRYGEPGETSPQSMLTELSPRSRYRSVGGSLKRLPFTAWEIAWVAETFGERGIPATKLSGDQATEANVRSQVVGRRIVHLACHGLTDQRYGRLFGALALTPGPRGKSDPANDGFLTLAETYELNLQRCELAILSACDTNLGPRQHGEGVFALSRGFLVAGSRRVVASNWLVDDEAAASLISYFCSGLANAEKSSHPVDYAGSLHKAKRWIRQQKKWSSPYYWGAFVLLGPD